MGEAVLLRVDLIFAEAVQQQDLPVLGQITHYRDLQKHPGLVLLPLPQGLALQLPQTFIFVLTGQ